MSVIKTLSASETNEQRDREKAKIEAEYRKSDRRLNELVSEHDQDLTKVRIFLKSYLIIHITFMLILSLFSGDATIWIDINASK